MNIRRFSLLFATACAVFVAAQDSKQSPICESISRSGSISIFQPGALDQRLQNQGNKPADPAQQSQQRTKTATGYRVQVYSANNSQSVQSEMATLKRSLNQKFPEYPVYIINADIRWRVQVGDFRNRAEAEALEKQIKAEFPKYKGEVKTVSTTIKYK